MTIPSAPMHANNGMVGSRYLAGTPLHDVASTMPSSKARARISVPKVSTIGHSAIRTRRRTTAGVSESATTSQTTAPA